MSKNFELMQQTSKGPEFLPARQLDPTTPPRYGNGSKNGHREQECLDREQLAAEEALRLVQRVFLLQTQEPPRVVAFAGIDHGNGCSRICVNIAETLARNIKSSVCLVEANLRSPALPGMFGTTNHHGLTDALLEDGPIRSFAKLVRGDNLWLISSGALAADSANLLNSGRLKSRLAELREEFEFVLIDLPPLTPYADAIVLGQMTDGLILVLEEHLTRREAARTVTQNLRASNIRILGGVLNKRTFPIPDSVYRRV